MVQMFDNTDLMRIRIKHKVIYACKKSYKIIHKCVNSLVGFILILILCV